MTTPPSPEAVEAQQSDTPRTDAQPKRYHENSLSNIEQLVSSDFARTLERELNASQAEVERLRARVAELEGRQ